MSYTQLKSDVADFAHRSDLDTKMDIFVGLSESMINKSLRVREMESATTLIVESISEVLPDDFLEVTNVVSITDGTTMEYIGSSQMSRLREFGHTSGNQFYNIINNKLHISNPGTVADPVDISVSFYHKVPTLTLNATNDVLDTYPLVYLSAMLVQVYKYVQDTEQMQIWQATFESELAMANKSDITGRVLRPSVRAI